MHRPLNVTRTRLQRVDSRAGICYESRVTNGRMETEKAGENCWGKEEGGIVRRESVDKGRKMGGRKENWSCEGCRVEELRLLN